MNFGEQIKKLRSHHQLTQQEMAERIGVSRQAISNWENDRNLPDIEMLIILSKEFQISLDQLILGGTEMNNMTQKLIDDGSQNKRIAMNIRILKIGIVLLIASVIFFLIGLLGQPSLENFFALASSITLYCGLLTFLVLVLKNVADFFMTKEG